MDAIIIGGGLAGLTCTRQLCASGLSCQLLEASDAVGGRVRTDSVDGFLLDRGFQVFLTAYPEARAVLDYEKLNLRRFEPGALIRLRGKFQRLSDPWRRPRHLLATAFSPAATLSDKLRIGRFRGQVTRCGMDEIFQRPEQTTIAMLRERGFSDVIIERFLRPFFGGVFLEHELQTSSRMCEFVFRMFSLGDAAVPEQGMQQIPKQLASELPQNVVRTDCPVVSIDGQDVTLASGERLSADAVVIATEAPAARKLLGDAFPASGTRVSCLYFAADAPPLEEPILVLNGDGEGPINNLCVPSQVSRKYAPASQALVSISVLGHHSDQHSLQQRVQAQLESWFGPVAKSWRHLRTYDIEYALPSQAPPALRQVIKPAQVRSGVFICGDHCDTASINGAMASGRRAAEGVLEAFHKS